MSKIVQEIKDDLSRGRYETARRRCCTLLNSRAAQADEYLLLLHEAQRRLGDARTAYATAQRLPAKDDDQRITRSLLLAADCRQLSRDSYYRESAEARQGLSVDEYAEKMRNAAARHLEEARALAHTERQKQQVALASEGVTHQEKQAPQVAPAPASTGTGTVSGHVRWADGSPAGGVKVTLGLACPVPEADASTYLSDQMHYTPEIPVPQVLSTRTNDEGAFEIRAVPAGKQEFLAATLEATKFDIATRFLAQQIPVQAGQVTALELTLSDWQSAPTREVADHLAGEITYQGKSYRLVHREILANPFHFDFPRQLVQFQLPPAVAADAGRFLLLSSAAPAVAQPFQITGNTVSFFTDLPQVTDRVFGLYEAIDGKACAFVAPGELSLVPEASGSTAIISTGRASFRVAWGAGNDATAPLTGVRGEDGRWRGSGRLVLPAGVAVSSRQTRIQETGPLILSLEVAYSLSNGTRYTIRLTAHRDEAYLLVHEVCPDLPGAAFEFSLQEFSGGRGYLHWSPSADSVHWSDLTVENRECARLQESIPWWIPPAGFAFAMTPRSLEEHDFVGVFTIRRGDWIDRKFERLAQGPGDANRELDWPYPEMVGSTISMVTAHTTGAGDAFFHFGFFDGERHWGVLVSTIERNDGAWKEISVVQHKSSSPRIQDFKQWRLDEPDQVERPYVVTRREELIALRKKKQVPGFSRIFERISSGACRFGPVEGLRFAVDGDPVVAWRKKKELVAVAKIRSRMTLLGRDYSDMYSPVGARPITHWAEEYDLIAASGVFTAEEERIVRQFFMLMGHLYMAPDFMNWKYNSRNANFEADRTDVIGAIGLVFHGNPDAASFVEHAASLMEKSLNVYCTPGSGKWYENPACYYLHALKCRMNLAFHLATHGISDPTAIPRLKDFLRWGILLLTPPTPHRYESMRDGLSDLEYRNAEKVRRIAPVGDHAHVGPWVPDHYALLSRLYRKSDPEFADLLLWAWQAGGADGGYSGNASLIFATLTEADLQPVKKAPSLSSRRLEGFGAIFRNNFGAENESYLLFKQGPGGYRYHRTEGSIILFANGRPLIYDGGEAGETWRHTTLSFHDVHMPLAPGHVERFHSFPALDFAQGVHPVALAPGEPVYLSDVCHHDLVDLAYRRFAEPDPACSRLAMWIKDEYAILHDELKIDPGVSSYWHLQAVADDHKGDAKQGYRFSGRFGVDLQVLLPDQTFAAEKIEQMPILEYHLPPERSFSMRHLMLRGDKPNHYLAVLRPLGKGQGPVSARETRTGERVVGVHVMGDHLDDHLFFQRKGTQCQVDGISFTGQYAAVLRRGSTRHLVLLDAGALRLGPLQIESEGPAVCLTVEGDVAYLTAEGRGNIKVAGLSQPLQLTLESNRLSLRLG